MKQSAWFRDSYRHEVLGAQHTGYLSRLKFLTRYPVFLLGFGPPIFRSQAIDATSGVIDYWSFLQVGWLSLIAFRAINRLVSAQPILIPKQIRSILWLAFSLGLLFLASAAYSPSHVVSAAYSVLYFLTLICVTEFIVDVYRKPPNWVECLFQLRHVTLFLLALVVLLIPIHPQSVMTVTTVAGVRLTGGTVTSAPLICPIIAIISAYSFLHSLESRGSAFLLFLVGLGGTLATWARGSEIALFICLSLVVMAWARTNQRTASAVISGAMAFMALVGLAAGAVGGGRIWNTFNKGQSVAGIESASGRTEIWAFVVKYCLAHPQGMGYVAGFRIVFRQYFSLKSGQTLSQLGSAHNTFVDVLAGAGWLALGIYLIMMVKIVKLAWRFAKRQSGLASTLDRSSLHGIRCSLVLLVFCFTYGMGATELSAPLRAGFYILYIIIAIVLGASANMLTASRANNLPPPRDISVSRGIEL